MKQKILVLEDDEDLLETFKLVLEEEGYSVVTLSKAKKFKRLMRRNLRDFDLMIMDVKLPDGDGSELAAKVKREDEDAKVILCSAWGDLEKRAREVKADSYIKKPFELAKMIDEVEGLLAEPD